MSCSGTGRRTRNYFGRYVDRLCYCQSVKSTSLSWRHFTTDHSFSGKHPAFKVKSMSTGLNNQVNEPQNIENLIDALMVRSREITTQASAEISRGQKLSSDSKSPTSPSPSIHMVQNAIESADVLLSLTSNVLIRNHFQKRQKNNLVKEEVTLHFAFLSVTTWICSILSSSYHRENHSVKEKNLLLRKLLELSTRSTELLLPLPLPTYRNIADNIAEYYETDNGAVGLVLLDIYVQAENCSSTLDHNEHISNHMLVEPASRPFFFFSPLKSLIRRRKYLDAVRILEGMGRFKVSHLLEPSLGLQLLILIKKIVDETPPEQPTDFKNLRVLVDLIEKPLMNELHSEKNNVRDFIESIGLVQIDSSEEDDVDDDEIEEDNVSESTLLETMDENWDSFEGLNSHNGLESDDMGFDNKHVQGDEAILKADVDKLNELVVSIHKYGNYADEKINQEAVQVAASIISKVRQLRQHSQNDISDSSLDPYSTNSPSENQILDRSRPYLKGGQMISPTTNRILEFREEVLSDSVYVRDYDMWDLPDVTTQFVAVNKNRDLRFCKEYEDTLVREILLDELEKMDNVYHRVLDDDDEDDGDLFEDVDDDDDDDDDDDGCN